MLAIKLRRQGKKHQASFRVVVAEKRSKLGGKFVDDLGWYDPHSKKFELKNERVEHWMKVGAKPTDSAHNLLVRAGIVDTPKIPVHSTKKKKKEEGPPAEGGAPAVPTDKPAEEGASESPVAKVKTEEKKVASKESKAEEKAKIEEPAPADTPKEEEPKVEDQ